MVLAIASVALLLFGNALAATTPYRSGTQLKQFSFTTRTNCAGSNLGYENGTCVADPTLVEEFCGDGTFCQNGQGCGIWGGTAGCCTEDYDAFKTSLAGDPFANISCAAYQQQLTNFDFNPHNGAILPQAAFCNDKAFPNYTPLPGQFSSEYSNITTMSDGTTCCPNSYDIVVQHTETFQNQTQALCVLPILKDSAVNKSSTATATSSASTSTSTSSANSAGVALAQPALVYTFMGMLSAALLYAL
ncbi:hypothetical protein BP5796_11540 [Coleophoma crateriformis]|uniref:Uncharacterized protein n=1 Tax=Coleophoma crateriformis TaxID=565419 RepID=A0A3D8QIW0_9HELO|nr:hypothetical protein BP5796_11540 [Coleophoma crateriformis]